MLGIAFSRRLAVLSGILLPAIETVRRRQEWPGSIETWPFWLDDYVVGALLVGAAWLSRPRPNTMPAQRSCTLSYLTAAWGIACGLMFGSALAQYGHLIDPSLADDPSGIAHGWVLLIKVIILAIGVLGLATSMRGATCDSRSSQP